MTYKVNNKQKRNMKYEDKFRKYLYKGDYQRCKSILNELNAEVRKGK